MIQSGIRRLLAINRPLVAPNQVVRLFAASRSAQSVANPQAQLPPNLNLQDESILHKPEKPPVHINEQGLCSCFVWFICKCIHILPHRQCRCWMPATHTAFKVGTLADLPSLEVPVRSFINPAEEPKTTYALSKHVFTVPIRKDIVLEVVRYQVRDALGD